MMWARHAGMATGGMGLWGTGSNAQFDAYVNQVGSIYFRQSNTNQSVGAGIQPQTWNHYAFTWSKSANTRKIFVNGVERSSRQFDAGASIGSTLFVGSLTAGAAYGTNGEIDEFTLLDYAADPKLIRAIYESDAPVFVESSVFHWRSPSRVPIWVDEFGLWARGVSGNEILGLFGGDPRDPTGTVTRSWGGITMEENDIVIGRAAQAAVHWDDSAGTLLIGRPAGANLLLSGGAVRLRNGASDSIVLDGSGNASIAGVLTVGSIGGIYQGTGSFASPTTGLKIWNDGGFGRIAGYDSSNLLWSADRNGLSVFGSTFRIMLDQATAIARVYCSNPLSSLLTNSTGVGVRTEGVYSGEAVQLYARSSTGRAAELTLDGGTNTTNNRLRVLVYSGVYTTSSLLSLDETEFSIAVGNANVKDLTVDAAGNVTIAGYLGLKTVASTPASPGAGAQGNVYIRNNRFIVQYNDSGTVRYKYLDLSGTGITWVHTTTPP